MSRRVMNIISEFAPSIEVYSIDEAFIDLSDFPDNEVEKIGKEIEKQFYSGQVFQLV